MRTPFAPHPSQSAQIFSTWPVGADCQRVNQEIYVTPKDQYGSEHPGYRTSVIMSVGKPVPVRKETRHS